MGDFSGDLGNPLGCKGRRGLKQLDLTNYFNVLFNLMNMCAGPLETFNSFCGRCHTTVKPDYIFVPICLLSSITSAKTFEAYPGEWCY